MGTVTIPFDYFELPYSEQQKITPICIPACDKNGKRIALGWFEAASRVEERLRSMTRRILHDERLVSEVAEGGVHNSWHAHGENLSRSPEGLIVRNAGFHALNIGRVDAENATARLLPSKASARICTRLCDEIRQTTFPSTTAISTSIGSQIDWLLKDSRT